MRAAVAVAFEAKGTPEFREACERVVLIHELWPLTRYEAALERARRRLDTARRQRDEILRLLQETDPKGLGGGS